MLLNNYIATLYSDMKVTSIDGKTNYVDFNSTYIRSLPGNLYSEATPGNNVELYPFTRGIALGSGTTPPQKTDYKLESPITTGLTYFGNNTNQTNEITSWVQTVQNTSTAQITITEVGLFSQAGKSIGCTFLLTRTVLDTPVVLQPDEVKTFTITIDYSKFVDGTIIQNS